MASNNLSTTTEKDSIVCTRADPSKYEEILKLFLTDFEKDEAMRKALGITVGETRSKLNEEYYRSRMDDNLSVMAMDSGTGRVVGAAIIFDQASKNPMGLAMRDELVRSHPNWSHIMRFFSQLEERVTEEGLNRVFGTGPRRTLEINIAVVSRDFRGKGILRRMVTEAHRIARLEGFTAARTEATGKYSQLAFSNLGYQVMAELEYADYTDENGARVFEHMDPEHKSCTVVGIKL